MAENPTRAKICGLTNLPDAELAVELGAWALGMIFYEQSPRRCSPAEADRIASALRRKVELCGVFVNAPLERVVGLQEELGLSLLQFNGDEGPSFCAEAARRTGARVIKAAQVSGPGDVRDLERFHVDFHLLDARAKDPAKRDLRGGTGDTFDWSLVRSRHSRLPLILSGGLDAENVVAAIVAVRPYAVDSASGTESTPGHKDPRKLRAFLSAVASATDESEAAAGDQVPAAADDQVPAAAGELAPVATVEPSAASDSEAANAVAGGHA
jgi:phosphoribosylanthranilate isomerase